MQYSLVNGLNKSAKTVEFIPGVGITSYDYHGYAGVAPDSAEWEGHFKLIEFFRGEPTVTLGIEVSLPDDAVFYIPAVGDGEIRGMVSLAKHPHSWIRITPRMRADSMKTEVSALPKADKKEPEANSDGENGKGADAGSYEGKEGSLLFSGLGQLGLPVLKARVVRAYGPPPGGFHHPYANSSAFCSCHFSKPRSIVDSDGSASSGVVGIISYPDAGKCVEISGCGRCCRTSLP
jgi:hypothetical protein